jgi:hypothetical protein
VAAMGAAAVLVFGLPFGMSGRTAVSEESKVLFVEMERSCQLDQALARVAAIREERCRIIDELDVGTITLDEALEQSFALNEEDSIVWKVLQAHFPGATSEEIAGYQLLIAAQARPEGETRTNGATVQGLRVRLLERLGDRALLPPHHMDGVQEPVPKK